jgi:hypothetical protein
MLYVMLLLGKVELRPKFVLLLSLLALLAVFCTAGLSQTISGSISGVVLDSTGASVGQAKVTATDLDRKSSVTSTTDNAGHYAFPSLQPGHYTISIEAPGFKKFEATGLTLLGNENLTAPKVTLQLGAVTESIEVNAQGVQLQTDTAERSESLDSKQVTNIALNGRSYLPLVALVPGVTTAPSLPTASHGGVGSITVNGGRSNQNNLTLDGVGDVDTGNNGDQLATVSLDSVQEFRILTSNYQAQYGRSSGAQISVVTKSGTSQFHGSGYIWHRNDSLNANNWLNNRDGLPRSKFRFNDAGYTLGGPLFGPGILKKLKDKVYFFTSEEFQNQLQPHGINRNMVPTALERQGNFSQSVDKNGKPITCIKDPTTRACYPGNMIPQSSLYAPGLAALSAYPLPNASGNVGYNYQSQVSAAYPRREDLGRVDLNLNSKNKIFARFIYNHDAVTSPYGSFVLGSNIPKAEITDARPGRSWAINWTSNVTPTSVNEFTWGFGKNVININPTSNVLTRTFNGLEGLPLLYPSAVVDDFIPTFNFDGTRLSNTSGFGTSDAPFFNYNTSIELVDNFSKVWNNHVIKIGAYTQRSRKDQTTFSCFNGCYDFQDNPNNPYDTGYGFANAAAGVYNSFSQASAALEGHYRYTNIEWYAQDTWKVTSRFTLDYGLRFYWVQPQYEELQQTSNFYTNLFNPANAPRLYTPALQAGKKVAQDPGTGATLPSYAIGDLVTGSGNLTNGLLQAGKGTNKYLMKNPGILYSPRFGFAWDVTGQQKLVIRAGAGMFYDRYQGNEIFNLLNNPPNSFAPNLNFGFVNTINPANALLGPSSLTAMDPNGPIPTTSNYSFGVQTKLPYDIVLDTSYVGSKSWHLLDNRNLNAIPYGSTFLPQNQDPTQSTGGILGSHALPSNLIRPYLGYGDIKLQEFASTSNFNSLQVSVQRQFATGLNLGLAYTYSKALGVTSGDGDYTRIDNLTRFANYGPLNFDRRQVLAINYIYDFPQFFKTRNAVLHTVLDGWQISGLTKLQTGAPYEVGFSVPNYGNPQITGSYTEPARVQVVGDPYAGTSQSPYFRLNPNAFAPATPGNLGRLGLGEGRNPFYGPGMNDTDLSLQKTFYFGERIGIELRMDAFNAFNHPQFYGGSNCNGSGINCTVNFANLSGGVTNSYLNSNGTINNKNGFGTVANAAAPRILQLGARIVF